MPQIIIDRGPNPRDDQTALLSVVGDSLTYASAPTYNMRTRRFSLALDAQVSRNTAAAPAALDRTRASQADVVIIALGTNDAYNASRYRALVADALARVNPVAQLIWVLPHRWHPAMDAVRAATLDGLRSRPRTTVLDDDVLWTLHPEYRASDGAT